MSKLLKKFISVVLTLVLVVSSITVTSITAKAEDAETVVTISITSAEIDKNNGITVKWEHPEGMEKYIQEYYFGRAELVVEDEDHWAKNGTANYVWGQTTGRKEIDNVVTAKNDSSIHVENGGDYIVRIVYKDDNGIIVARGTTEPLTFEKYVNVDMSAFQERNENLIAYLKWKKVTGASSYKVFDAYENKITDTTLDYAAVTLEKYNTEYLYTIKAYDKEDNEIADVINNEVKAIVKNENYVEPGIEETTTKNSVFEKPNKPEGLTHSPGADNSLPHNFAWGPVDGAESYNIYINDDFVGESTNLSYDAAEYFATAVAGTYTIAVTAVANDVESEKATISYIVEDDGTESKTPVTAPTIAGKTFTGDILTAYIPEGNYTVEKNEGGTDVGSYEVVLKIDTDKYYWSDDETKSEETKTLTFEITKANREEPTGLSSTKATSATSADGKISGVSDEMEYKAEGADSYTAITGTEITNLAAGKYYVRFKETPNHKPSADKEVVVEAEESNPPVTKPDKPSGLENSPGADNSFPYNFAWGPVDGATYNIYVDGVLVGTSPNTAYNITNDDEVFPYNGEYTIGVTAVVNGIESDMVTIIYTVTNKTDKPVDPDKPTDPVEPPTDPVEPPTVATPVISEVKASSSSSSTIDVEWTVTNDNNAATYKVYLNDKLVQENITGKKITITNVTPGKHQVKVEGVLDGETILGKLVDVEVNITLTITKNSTEYKYVLGSESEYTLPATHKEFVSKYPELVSDGYIFTGFYTGNTNVTKITEDTTLTTKWRIIKTKLKKVKCVKGKVKFTFNKKDWKNLDGFKITYSTNKKFKKKKSKYIYVNTKGKKTKSYTVKKANKKFKNGGGYYIKVEFFYNSGETKVYCSGNNKATLLYRKK